MLHMTEGAVTVVRSRMWVSLRKVLSFLRKSRLVMTGNTLSFFRIDWIFRIRAVTSCALNAFCSMTISTELVSGDVLSGKEALLAGEGISVDLSKKSLKSVWLFKYCLIGAVRLGMSLLRSAESRSPTAGL